MEYNINKRNKIEVGDTLRDNFAEYVVKDTRWLDTHSQYASEVLVECVSGRNKGELRWISHHLLLEYKV